MDPISWRDRLRHRRAGSGGRGWAKLERSSLDMRPEFQSLAGLVQKCLNECQARCPAGY